MKSKLFKCALSFALASALVFCTTLICYTQIDNCASASGLELILGIGQSVLDVKNTVELLSELFSYSNLANSDRFIALSGECRVAWKSLYSYFKNETVFRQFVKDVQSFAVYCSNGEVDPYSHFISTYGEDFREVFFNMVNVVSRTFPNSSDISLSLFNDVDELCAWLSSTSSSDYYFDDNNNAVVPSTDFKEAVEEANTQYSPKNAIGKMSYRTDKRWHEFYSGSSTQYYNYLSFYTKSNFSDGFTAVNGGDDMYTLFFYTDGTDTYYSRYQFHWVVNPLDPQYDSSGENITSWGTSVDLYYWDCLNSSETDSLYKNFYKCVSCNNYSLQVKSNGFFEFLPHDNYSGYLSYKRGNTVSDLKYISISDICDLMSLDLSTSIKLTSASNHFKGDFSAHDSSCDCNGVCDYGYIASTTPIQFTYLMDTSRIPDNYYVTITGDTIYDYSITNPETGQSDTINNYITNNYTYVTNNNGGENSGGSGGVGGNVTVGGQIDVSGNVGVDVNVNINNGDNGGENIGDYIDASGTDVDVGGVLGKLPELSKGFVDYLKGFFAWLPAEIYSLIILILVISVWNVFRSRR